jgi:hypothetical protein
MINGRFDAKIRWVRNQLKCIDFATGVDQEGLILISICSKIKSSNKVSDYLRMTTKGMDELLWGRKFEDVHDWVE